MRNWKVIIEHNDKMIQKILSGDRYSDVCIEIITEYPSCEIISITEIHS